MIQLIAIKAMAQNTCPVDNTNTYNEVKGTFDWQDITDDYTNINLVKDGVLFQPIGVTSPFNSQSNWNVQDFYDNFNISGLTPDMLNSDGWEIIQYEFGTPSVPLTIPPHFILYNKHTGVLRVFILQYRYLLAGDDINGISIMLSFDSHFKGQSAALANASPVMASVENFTRDQAITVPDVFEADNDYTWLRADFVLNYDPCTCENPDPTAPPTLNFNVNVINTSNLQTYSTITGTITQEDVVGNSGAGASQTVNTQNGYLTNISTGLAGLDAFSKNYDNTNKFFEAIGAKQEGKAIVNTGTTTTTATVPRIVTPTPLIMGSEGSSALQTIDLASVEGTATAGAATTAAAADPEIAVIIGAIGLFDFVMTTIQNNKNSVASESGAFVGQVNETAVTTGTLTNSQPATNFDVILPGTNNNKSDPTQNPNYPYYNNVLGVFSVLKTPIVEYTEYTPTGTTQITCDTRSHCSDAQEARGECERGDITAQLIDLPNIREYRVKDDIQWALNPAADVDLVGIKAALTFSYGNLPLDSGGWMVCPPSNIVQRGLFEITSTNLLGLPNGFLFQTDAPVFNGPVQVGVTPAGSSLNDYPNRLTQNNVEIEAYPAGSNALVNYTYRIPYSSLGCLTTNSAKFFTAQGKDPTIILKFIVTVRPKGQTTDDNDIIFVLSYQTSTPVNTGASGLHYTLSDNQGTSFSDGNGVFPCAGHLAGIYVSSIDANPNWTNPTLGIVGDLVINTPTTISSNQTFQGFNSITINAPITFAGNPGDNITALFVTNGVININAPINFPNPAVNAQAIFDAGINVLTGPEYTETGQNPEVQKNSGASFVTSTSSGVSACDRAVPAVTDFTSFCKSGGAYSLNAFPEARLAFEANSNSSPVNTRVMVNTSSLSVTPNPITQTSTIYYSIKNNDNVTLSITDIIGKPVMTLVDSYQNKGNYQIAFPAGNLADGVYLCTLFTSEGLKTQKVVIAR